MSFGMNVFLTAVIALLTVGLSLWSRSPIHADQVWLVMMIAAGTIASIWFFPRAGF